MVGVRLLWAARRVKCLGLRLGLPPGTLGQEDSGRRQRALGGPQAGLEVMQAGVDEGLRPAGRLLIRLCHWRGSREPLLMLVKPVCTRCSS